MPRLHLLRMQKLVTEATAAGNTAHINLAVAALKWWIENDPMSANWWHNQIGSPRLLAHSMLLLGEHVPPDVLARSRKIFDRAGNFVLKEDNVSRSPFTWTGANLLWISANQVLAGALTGDEALIGSAVSAALQEVRISPRTEEGIQVDGSFHQHGPLLYNGGYGNSFLCEGLFFFESTHGTRWAPEPHYHELIANFLLDGTRWMLRGEDYNHGCRDREITRPRQTNISLAPVAAFLAEAGGTRQAELRDLADALRTGAAPGCLSGNRMFYRADFMVQHEAAACISVRMHSKRTIRAECCNDEGKLTHHVADGLTYLLRDGSEYQDIFPVWDWQKLPGITCLQTPKPEPRQTVGNRGNADLVGGVSNGRHGACMQHLRSDHLNAHKSWFFGPGGVVCLGAGIRSSFAGPVVTTLDQSIVQGQVERGDRWLRHGPWGFIFPEATKVTVECGPKTGSWDLIGSSLSDAAQADVFLAYVNHGDTPDNATYAYLVTTDASADELTTLAASPAFQIAANTDSCQAVWWPETHLLQVSFFSPGSVSWLPGCTLTVDRECCVMLQSDGSGGWTLDAADIKQFGGRLSVELSSPSGPSKQGTVIFPEGDYLGQTARITL